MLKHKVTLAILVLTIAIGVLGGCSSGKLVDGTYKVEFEDFDSHGYKSQLELTISGGKITEASFDEVDKDGNLKSKDEQYKGKMEEQSGTYPEEAYAELEKRLVSKQTADIDAVTGATASSKSFKTLVKYALDDMAKKGTTTSAKIPAAKE